MAVTSPLIGDPSRLRDNDYDVLEDGKVVGRIFCLDAVRPQGRPWKADIGFAGEVQPRSRFHHTCTIIYAATAIPTPARFRPLGPPMFDSLKIAS